MDKELYDFFEQTINRLSRAILKSKKDKNTKVSQLNILYNISKYIHDYDELEPVMREYYAQKTKNMKWGDKNAMDK